MPGGSAARLRREAIKARSLALNMNDQESARLLAIARSLDIEADAIEQALRNLPQSSHFHTP